MKLPFVLLGFLSMVSGDVQAAPGTANFGETSRTLMIDSSSMPMAGGTATLTIGMLRWSGGVYTGEYKIKVSPYFFKSEKGALAIRVSDRSLAQFDKGQAAGVAGTATTDGKDGKSRHIEATATPIDASHGTIKLWFMAGDRKMIFEPAYHFSRSLSADSARPKATNLASNFPRN